MHYLYEIRKTKKRKKDHHYLLQILFLHCFKDFEEQYQQRAKKSKPGNQGLL